MNDPEILPPTSPEDTPALQDLPPDMPAPEPLDHEHLGHERLAPEHLASDTLTPGYLAPEPPAYAVGVEPAPYPPPVPPLRDVPNLGHTLVLLVITVIFWCLSELVCFGIAMALHPGHVRVTVLASDPRFIVASEAIGYALTAGFAALVFPMWWHRPFLEGIHWNWQRARRRAVWLVGLGLAVGFAMSLFGSFLPMPKNPPIVKDIMSTPMGAWLMFLFSISGAPLFEEFAFRGFLLPSLINMFKWLGRREVLSPEVVKAIGVPISVVLTTLPFALMHSPQVSDAWGPLLLIGVVSLVLCGVRLALDSLAASTIVHASYNFTLFAGIIFSTGGFRHLDKLTS